VPTWIWIVIAVVVVLAIALGTGTVLARRRRISLKDAAPPPKPVTDGPPPKGGYKAGGSISFSAGSGTATAPPPPVTKPFPAVPAETERTEVDGQPAVGDDAAIPRDSPSRNIVDVALPDAPQAPAAAPTAPEAPEEIVAEEIVAEEIVAEEIVVADVVLTDDGDITVVDEVIVDEVVIEDVVSTEDVLAEEAAIEPPLDHIEPTAGRLNRLRGRLSRSQNAFGRSLLGLLGAGTLDEDSWTDVEDTLLMADLGAGAAAEITEKLKAEVAAHGVTDAASARALLRRVLIDAVGPGMDRSVRALPHDGRPSVLLIVGVNGTGKTTTTGKLARVLVADGRHVVLGAADTFRAAAAEQLTTWGERAGAVVVRAAAGTDPASVAFDAVKRGIEDGADAVLIDTAGRLHTKTGLMDELGKVKRVIEKQAKVDEILLVLDATTGQNGLVQATVFADVVDITGIVLTKLDGTAKGGIVVAVQRTLNVPVKLVGLGEGADDLAPFEPAAFVDALLGD
jgi:fused signal recognition particle receptor